MIVTFTLENTKVSTVHAPNSRVHWAVKHKVGQTCQKQASTALKQALRELGKETIQPPVKLTCYRRFSGQQKAYDFDNLPSTFKPFVDGIKKALEFDDDPKHMAMRFYQERGKKNELEFVLEEVEG